MANSVHQGLFVNICKSVVYETGILKWGDSPCGNNGNGKKGKYSPQPGFGASIGRLNRLFRGALRSRAHFIRTLPSTSGPLGVESDFAIQISLFGREEISSLLKITKRCASPSHNEKTSDLLTDQDQGRNDEKESTCNIPEFFNHLIFWTSKRLRPHAYYIRGTKLQYA